MGSVGVPSARTMGQSFGHYAKGAMGGAIQGLVSGMTGNKLIGSLAGPLVAGSMIKGVSGDVIATVAGMQIGQALVSGGLGGGSKSSGRGVM